MNFWSQRFSQNMNENLYALCCGTVHRAEILTIFCSYFGRNDDCINSFWNLLTFSMHFVFSHSLISSGVMCRHDSFWHSKHGVCWQRAKLLDKITCNGRWIQIIMESFTRIYHADLHTQLKILICFVTTVLTQLFKICTAYKYLKVRFLRRCWKMLKHQTHIPNIFLKLKSAFFRHLSD